MPASRRVPSDTSLNAAGSPSDADDPGPGGSRAAAPVGAPAGPERADEGRPGATGAA